MAYNLTTYQKRVLLMDRCGDCDDCPAGVSRAMNGAFGTRSCRDKMNDDGFVDEAFRLVFADQATEAGHDTNIESLFTLCRDVFHLQLKGRSAHIQKDAAIMKLASAAGNVCGMETGFAYGKPALTPTQKRGLFYDLVYAVLDYAVAAGFQVGDVKGCLEEMIEDCSMVRDYLRKEDRDGDE